MEELRPWAKSHSDSICYNTKVMTDGIPLSSCAHGLGHAFTKLSIRDFGSFQEEWVTKVCVAAFPQGLALQAWCMDGAYMQISHHEEIAESVNSCLQDSVIFPAACFEGKLTGAITRGFNFSTDLCAAAQNEYRRSCFFGWGLVQKRLSWEAEEPEQICESVLREEEDKVSCLDGVLHFTALTFMGDGEAIKNWPFEKYCQKYEEGSSRHKKCMGMTRFGLFGFEPDLDKAQEYFTEYVAMDKLAAL